MSLFLDVLKLYITFSQFTSKVELFVDKCETSVG